MNVTALVSTSGTVVERVVYDPYGKPKFYDGSWENPSDTSAYANEILYCGYRWDPETGLYHVRHRYYHPTLGRWVSRDPAGYEDGNNLYECVGSAPALATDPLGKGAVASDTFKDSWEVLGEDRYKAIKDGADIRLLSRKVLNKDSSWVCAKPESTPNEDRSRVFYEEKKGLAACNDEYNVSTLKARGPAVFVAFLKTLEKPEGRKETPTEEGKRILVETWLRWLKESGRGHKPIDDANELAAYLRDISQQGNAPIGYFELNSHTGSADHLGVYISTGPSDLSKARFLPEKHLLGAAENKYDHLKGERPDFTRAKEGKFPPLCWFAAGGESFFVGCSSYHIAEYWARSWGRSGIGGGGAALGLAHAIQSAAKQPKRMEISGIGSEATDDKWITYGQMYKNTDAKGVYAPPGQNRWESHPGPEVLFFRYPNQQ
jgi:RHS repeat-associated protein